MQPVAPVSPVSKVSAWAGRIITTLVVLFLLFDSAGKLMKESHVMEANRLLGYPESQVVTIGVILLVCTVIYVIPATSILGAVLLTGYLGGAVASNMRISHPAFECLFPVIVGVLVWGGLFLRDASLRTLLPLRR